jgi:hypothetical protein
VAAVSNRHAYLSKKPGRETCPAFSYLSTDCENSVPRRRLRRRYPEHEIPDRKLDHTRADFEQVIMPGTRNPEEFFILNCCRIDQFPAMGSWNERVFLTVNH